MVARTAAVEAMFGKNTISPYWTGNLRLEVAIPYRPVAFQTRAARPVHRLIVRTAVSVPTDLGPVHAHLGQQRGPI